MSVSIFFLLAGFILIATELVIMQFSVFWLLFFGIGALLASLVSWFVPEMGYTGASAVFLIGSLATAAVLYPPLKRWQNKPGLISGNDTIGKKVKVVEAIVQGSTGKVTWSGTTWPAELSEGAEPLKVGDIAVVKQVEGIRLIVAP